MSIVVKISDVHMRELFSRLNSAVQEDVIKKSLKDSGNYLVRWITKNRLTGPRPRYLGVVSNRLKRSITASEPAIGDDGWFVSVGTNVEYAPAHEFGFRGSVTVSPHFRKRKVRTRLFGRTRNTRTGDVFVNAHTRRMNIRARPFLKPAIDSRTNQLAVLMIFTKHINKALETTK